MKNHSKLVNNYTFDSILSSKILRTLQEVTQPNFQVIGIQKKKYFLINILGTMSSTYILSITMNVDSTTFFHSKL